MLARVCFSDAPVLTPAGSLLQLSDAVVRDFTDHGRSFTPLAQDSWVVRTAIAYAANRAGVPLPDFLTRYFDLQV